MASDNIQASLRRLTADMDHKPSDEELKTLLDAVATVIKFKQEGWLKKIAASNTAADFRLVRLPPDDVIPNFVRMLCVSHKLSNDVYAAALRGRYSLQSVEGCHMLHIGDSPSNLDKVSKPGRKWWQFWR